MAKIGSGRRRWAILFAVISCGCGPTGSKTAADGQVGEDRAAGGGAGTEEAVTPADHDIEVPPAP